MAHRCPLQRGLFCPCGEPALIAGFCRPCYRQHAHSAACFGGHRATVLHRDGQRCRTCSCTTCLVVHHRRPGVNRPSSLITLCAACHAQVHRLETPRAWMPPLLRDLWREQHRTHPLQFQLDFAVTA